jgi:WD40 repeat protein
VLVSASLDKTMVVLGVIEGQSAAVRHRLTVHTHYVDSIALSPDERFVVSGSTGNVMQMWDMDSGQQIRVVMGLPTGELEGVVWSPDGQCISSVVSKGKAVCVENVDIKVSVAGAALSFCFYVSVCGF